MKVWVVTSNSWNGDHDAVGVSEVFASEEAAKRYCEENKRSEGSTYGTTYDYEEYEVKS